MSENKTTTGGEPAGDHGGDRVVLYHFTALGRMAGIGRAGIIKGDVPITPGGGYNAPWLTIDPSFGDAQAWSFGSFQDKQRLRLTVEIPTGDENLKKWTDVARETDMDPVWLAALNQAGGSSHEDWYLYHGVIPPEWITHIEDREGKLSFPDAAADGERETTPVGGRLGGRFQWGEGMKTADLARLQFRTLAPPGNG